MAQRRVLTLVAERKLSDLIAPPKGSAVLEASGVVAKDDYYYVVFDNFRRIASVHMDLNLESKAHGWFGPARDGEGYEDIAFSPDTRRFYLLIEAEKHPDGTYKALIDECDEEGKYKRRRWVDFVFKNRNTGFEGLAAVHWKGTDYLLAMCEGNRGKGGRKGKKPGGGRVQVLKRAGTVWKPIACIDLPKSVKFEDYSAVSIRGNQIAVISQQTSQLWTGTVKFADWTVRDEGTIYDFPRTRKGNLKYCALEGLCWLSARSFALVSDLAHANAPKRCRKHDQSIHVFRIPSKGAGLLSSEG
jgi:hypothetical protein